MQTITFHTEFDVEDFVTELWAKFGQWADDIEGEGPFVFEVKPEYDDSDRIIMAGSPPPAGYDPDDPNAPSF